MIYRFEPWSQNVSVYVTKSGYDGWTKSITWAALPLLSWETPDAEAKLLQRIPYSRVGEAYDIGAVAVWPASDESDYIHRTTIFVDGGMTLYPGFTENG